jgi:hypothetical protein
MSPLRLDTANYLLVQAAGMNVLLILLLMTLAALVWLCIEVRCQRRTLIEVLGLLLEHTAEEPAAAALSQADHFDRFRRWREAVRDAHNAGRPQPHHSEYIDSD